MKIVIAVDKFKGSLDAPAVAAALGAGLREGLDDVEILEIPVADGGEGSLDAALRAGFREESLEVTGPTGAPITARFGLRGEAGAEAVIEMAQASGLDALPGGIRDSLGASSTGTGELIRAALDRGATRIILAVGGSAGTDGGAGMLSALGVALTDAQGTPIAPGGGGLTRLEYADLSGLDPRLSAAAVTLASDVDNPLCGPRGAAAVFGPQKGAGPEHVATLEAGLDRFASVLAAGAERLHPGSGAEVLAAAREPGAGAAGGVGYAALAILRARRRPGIEVILELTGLSAALHGADLVITGEGSLDAQSLGGKTPMGVAQAAHLAGIPVLAVAGISDLSVADLTHAGFLARYLLSDLEPDPGHSMRNAAELLSRVGLRIARDLPNLLS